MAMEGRRSKRSNVTDRVDVPVDMVSQLPDSVLSHILSLLTTTKEVVRTRILSKRWKNLWTQVHTLVFWGTENDAPVNMRFFPEKMQFSQFVNRVLHYHRGPIKKMSIASVYITANDYDIRNWISCAIDRGVEIIDICGLCVGGMKFRWPFCLFRSQTLVDLRLSCLDISNLNIPSAPFFPSLKKLDMWMQDFDSESVEPLQLLISGCSLLEDLSIEMDISHGLSFNLSSFTLKRLKIVYSFADFDDNFHPTFVLDVPALEFLRVSGPPADFLVKNQLSSLTEVDIDINRIEEEDEDICYNSLVRLMEHISNVKVLQLECNFDKPLTYPMNAKYPNLTELKIMSSCCEWHLLEAFMKSSINLERITLVKHSDTDNDMENQVYWIDPQNVPHCLLSSLRKISITRYKIENALDMVDYVLRNAELLERMDIDGLKSNGDYKAQCEILLKLVMIRRASRGCQISFV